MHTILQVVVGLRAGGTVGSARRLAKYENGQTPMVISLAVPSRNTAAGARLRLHLTFHRVDRETRVSAYDSCCHLGTRVRCIVSRRGTWPRMSPSPSLNLLLLPHKPAQS